MLLAAPTATLLGAGPPAEVHSDQGDLFYDHHYYYYTLLLYIIIIIIIITIDFSNINININSIISFIMCSGSNGTMSTAGNQKQHFLKQNNKHQSWQSNMLNDRPPADGEKPEVCVYIYIYICITCVYIYIYIERERE